MFSLQWIVGNFIVVATELALFVFQFLGLNNVDLEAGQLGVFTTVVIWMLWHRWFVASVVMSAVVFWPGSYYMVVLTSRKMSYAFP